MNTAIYENQPAHAGALSPSKRLEEIESLMRAGVKTPHDYVSLARMFDAVEEQLENGIISKADIKALREANGPAMGPDTIQGRIFLKPRGFAGDFQTIDDIYTHRLAADPALRVWDEGFHSCAAPQAVRNRKGYFKRLLEASTPGKTETLQVLDVACGPCRDVSEYLEQYPEAPVHFTCLDQDADALTHGERLCAPFAAKVSFVRANALKYSTAERYDLVWSAGLFDYLSNDYFVVGLQRLARLLKPSGEIVIGNFAPENPERAYMELFGEWVLNYRSREELLSLAQQAGLTEPVVDQEPLGINLFLRARRA